MKRFTEFKRDGDVVTAIPQSSNQEPVRFDASIADRKEDEEEVGHWEALVSELMDYELGEALDIEDGAAVISREQAISALVEADDEFATTDWQAEAVVEYLADEDILEVTETGEVTVLKPFDEITDTGYSKMYNNWAAMFDTCIERIDYARDRVEQAKQRFEKREEQTDRRQSNVDPEQRLERTEQKIKNLVGNRSPSQLEGEERERFKQLREQYHFYENMIEVEGETIGTGDDRVGQLGRVMERFETMRGVMVDRREEFRELALGEAIFPEDLVELSEQYAGFLSSMSDVMAPKDKMEEQDDDEFFESLGTEDELEEVTEQAERMSEPAVERQA